MTVWYNAYASFRREPRSTPVTDRIAELFTAAEEAGEDFGACHIVISDFNIEREHIQYCLDQPNITPEGQACMEALFAATYRERCIGLAKATDNPFHEITDEEWSTFYHDYSCWGFANKVWPEREITTTLPVSDGRLQAIFQNIDPAGFRVNAFARFGQMVAGGDSWSINDSARSPDQSPEQRARQLADRAT